MGSEPSEKLPNESTPQKPFQLARDLFSLMGSVIICIHFRKTQPPICLKINAASLIRNTLAIILPNLLKQDLTFSSNTFKGHIMWILLPRRHLLLLSLVVVVAIVVVVVVVVVLVAVVVVIVLVAMVVVVVKSCPELVNTNLGP